MYIWALPAEQSAQAPFQRAQTNSAVFACNGLARHVHAGGYSNHRGIHLGHQSPACRFAARIRGARADLNTLPTTSRPRAGTEELRTKCSW